MSHSREFRTRTLILFGLVALLAVFKVAHGSGTGPSDDAMALVPADAYTYAHADLNEVTDRFPVPGIEALAGDELAGALVPGPGGQPETLIIAKPDDPDAAKQYLSAHGGPGTESTERNGYLVFGPADAVDDAVSADSNPDSSLASDDTAKSVLADLPGDRIADAYVSQDGFGILQERGGAGASLDTFADFGASDGLAAALVPTADGLDLQLSSKLDPSRTASDPGFFSAFPSFEPSLAGLFDPKTLAYLAIGDPSQTVKSLLDQADAVEPGIAAAYNRLEAALKQSAGIDLTDDILPALGDQMAAGIAGRKLTIAFDGVDPERARTAVAQLAGPLISGINAGATGRAPTLGQTDYEGVKIIQVRVSPALTVSIGAFDGHLVISTDPKGVQRAIDGDGGLDVPSEAVSALLFLDVKGLVAFSKPLGLTQIRGYRKVREELARLGNLTVSVRSDDDSLDTDISLQIDQGDEKK